MKKPLYSVLSLPLIVITSALLFSACAGPEVPNDQMKVALPGNSPQPPTQQQVQSVPLQGKDIMIDQNTTQQPAASQAPANAVINATQATINTSKGAIKIKLYPQETPNTVQNFLRKAQANYYQNLIFHRVEDWVIQGGDPLGKGTGGGSMPTELSQTPFKEGSVGVARGGDIKVSNDSQFFICTKDCSWLTGQYTNFGEVTEGMDIVKQIQIGDKILSISYQ
jgi:peptidyl-prolyl cis-trans isomerase B (cyclophilin B)